MIVRLAPTSTERPVVATLLVCAVATTSACIAPGSVVHEAMADPEVRTYDCPLD
jgi:hypothetical protein